MGDVGAEQHLHQKLGAARGAAIVPCRARGMPVDHNFKTAYFVIPDGIEHGDELMCSYPACRQAGVKFRYCLHCKVPVAKRNFRNRHRHGVPGGDGASMSEEEGSDEEEEVAAPGECANPACGSDVCLPIGATGGDKGDYAGVKKEHILIIPGAEPASTSMPMKKKKKKSGNVRVPCRARGMPMAHNFKTAYFIIPPNIEHGDELLCSFPSCRSAGAKFRYCLHCKVPVAKRNFRNRHKHGNMGGLDKKKSSNLKTPESPEDKSNDGGKKEEAGSKMPGLPKPEEGKPAAEASAPVKDEDSKPSAPEPVKQEAVPSVEAAAEAPAPAVNADGTAQVSVSSSHDVNKVQKWVELLENKPDPGDKQAMAVWMLNLINATEGGAAAAAVAGMAAAPVAEAPAPVSVKAEAPQATAPLATSNVEQASPVDALVAAVVKAEEAADSSSPVVEEGTANSTSTDCDNNKRQGEEEECANSTSSGSSQPPKKKFKQVYEEV